MKVSIIFTVHQDDSIESISYASQTLTTMNLCLPVEFILVMNGSNNPRVFDKLLFIKRLIDTMLKNRIFNDTEIHVIHISVDIIEARRQGANIASGDWIVYLDADQNIEENRLEVLSTYINNFYPKAAILFNAYTVWQKDNIRGYAVDYFPSIWRDIETDAILQKTAISNFIGIAHKKNLGFSFNSEFDFTEQMITKNIPHAYCDIIAGGSPENRLINGNYNY